MAHIRKTCDNCEVIIARGVALCPLHRAAPDLLAKLKKLTAITKEYSVLPCESKNCPVCRAVAQADTAISEAGG